jgi:hypothetical protein
MSPLYEKIPRLCTYNIGKRGDTGYQRKREIQIFQLLHKDARLLFMERKYMTKR